MDRNSSRQKRSIFVSLCLLSAQSAFAGAPQFPTELDYGKLSPEQQREFESAAFLLNLRSLGVLEPDGVICAQPGKDANGNPTYNFSVQDKAFETGSCQLNANQSGLSEKIKKLAQATIEYQKVVQGAKEKLPVTVTGFADGQPFSTLGAQAKAACGELANSKKVNGSYNQPLAQSRARGIAGELASVLGETKADVRGFDSPNIVGTDLANCPTRRQVVISFGSSPAVNASQSIGNFEPSAQVDSTVQLAMNAAVSTQILRAHAAVQAKAGKRADKLDCAKKDDSCAWKHMQAVMTELGIDPKDTACRATTMGIADEVIGRALNTRVGKDMIALATSKSSDWAKNWIANYTNSKGKAREEMTECGVSAELHLMIPTSDMFGQAGKECAHKSVYSTDGTFVDDSIASANLVRIRNIERNMAASSVAKNPARVAELQKTIDELHAQTAAQFPGLSTMEDLVAYRNAGRSGIARRNLSHNCVKPDLNILATGFEASPSKNDYFVSPKSLGNGGVRMGYSEKSFSTNYHSQSGKHGFGCSACGSGVAIQKDGSLDFENDIVNRSLYGQNVENTFGKDGMNLIRGGDQLTAANFLAPALYEIPNCPDCSCVTSMQDALTRAFADGKRTIASSAHGLTRKGEGKLMETSALKNSCLFAPPIAHACPVGPNGKAEQSKQGAELERTLTYIDKALAPATANFTNDTRNVLAMIEGCGGGVPKLQGIDYYQKLVDGVVCDTRKDPIVLPENKGNEKAECDKAQKLLQASKTFGAR